MNMGGGGDGMLFQNLHVVKLVFGGAPFKVALGTLWLILTVK